MRPFSCSLKGGRGFRNLVNTGLRIGSQTWLCTAPLGVGLSPVLFTNFIPRFWNHLPSLEAVAGFAGFRASNSSLFARPSLLCHPAANGGHLDKERSPVEAQVCIKALLASEAQRPESVTLWLQRGRLTSLMPGVYEMLSNCFLSK